MLYLGKKQHDIPNGAVFHIVYEDRRFYLADKEKSALFRSTFGIASFDMETAAIASVCYFSGIPFGSLRQISDDADDADAEDTSDKGGADNA